MFAHMKVTKEPVTCGRSFFFVTRMGFEHQHLGLKVDPLNRMISLNTHLHDAYIDMDRLKFSFSVFITMFKCVENKTSIAPPMLIVIGRYIIRVLMGNVKSSAGLFSPADEGISAEKN